VTPRPISDAERAALREAGARMSREARARAGLPRHEDDPEVLTKIAVLLSHPVDRKKSRGQH
jgi:hypothetical protein